MNKRMKEKYRESDKSNRSSRIVHVYICVYRTVLSCLLLLHELDLWILKSCLCLGGFTTDQAGFVFLTSDLSLC